MMLAKVKKIATTTKPTKIMPVIFPPFRKCLYNFRRLLIVYHRMASV